VAEYRFDELRVGMIAKRRYAFSEQNVQSFADLVVDRSPIHTSHDFAVAKGYPARIVHGLFVQSVISGILGTEIPGSNSVINTISMKMHGPVPIGSEVSYEVEILALTPAVAAVSLGFAGRIGALLVISGKALCSFPQPISC